MFYNTVYLYNPARSYTYDLIDRIDSQRAIIVRQEFCVHCVQRTNTFLILSGPGSRELKSYTVFDEQVSASCWSYISVKPNVNQYDTFHKIDLYWPIEHVYFDVN